VFHLFITHTLFNTTRSQLKVLRLTKESFANEMLKIYSVHVDFKSCRTIV